MRAIGPVEIVPSLLAADMARLGEQVREAEAAGATRFQVDVMDGRFVPNLAMGPDVVAAVGTVSGAFLEAHLMVERPERFVGAFVGAGAGLVMVHVEATTALHRTLVAIAEAGAVPGVALNPATPVGSLAELEGLVQVVNVMTVEPGFGGQRFIPASPDKIRRVAELLPGVVIEVDGGIDAETAPACVEAGARLLVAGTSVFRHPGGVAAGMEAIRIAIR